MNFVSVLHVTAGMDPQQGGVCKAVRMIIAGLDKLGVRSEVASLDSPDASYLSGDLFPVHALGPGKGRWLYSNKLMPWLNKNISSFDAVIVHGLWLYTSYAVEKALHQYKKHYQVHGSEVQKVPKFFVMPHGMLDPYIQLARTRKLKAIRNWIYWKLIEQKVINKSDGLFFTCEEEKQLARQPFRPYTPKREYVVGLGVEDPPAHTREMQEAFLKRCPSLRNNDYILFLGRIHEKKGVDLLINAYAKLHDNKLAERAFVQNDSDPLSKLQLPCLVIAGPNLESAYGQKLQTMVSRNSLIRDRVFFPGMLAGDAKWGAFYGCEAFILPSHQENFGIAIVEALSCGKPVLITNKVNIWREIRAGGSGMVETDTLEGTKNLLKTWQRLTVPGKEQMKAKARESFENNFSIDFATRNIFKALNS